MKMDLDEVVREYVICGRAIGFHHAEAILMRFLPKGKTDGKCFDVPVSRRKALVAALIEARHSKRQFEPGA